MSGSPFPDPIVEPFGSSAGAGYITYPIPVPSQLPTNPGYASFADGFPPATMTPSGSGGVPPRGQDMNGILYMLSAYAALQTGGQLWQYNSTYETAAGGYAVGAILAMAAGNGFWINTVNGNTNNPDTTAAATSGWVPLFSYGVAAISGLTNANVTLTSVQACLPTITLSGTLTANIQLIFPAWQSRWRIINNIADGIHTVTAKTASGSGIVIPIFGSAGYTDIYGDGTNINFLGAYAAGTASSRVWTGWTSDPGIGVNYVVVGKIAYITLSSTQSTSNSTLFQLSGLPSFLTPISGHTCGVVGLLDNGAAIPGGAITTGVTGTINFYKDGAGTAWTASGLKGTDGLSSAVSFSYPLT